MKSTIKAVAGEFRFPVQVQRPTYVDDGKGGQTTTWNNSILLWCSVEEKASDEKDSDNSRVRSFQRYEFITWWGNDVVETDRILWQNRQFNIRCVENVSMRNKFMRIKADSGVEQ